MNFNFNQNRHMQNQETLDAEIQNQKSRETNRLELSNEDRRDQEDFSKAKILIKL